MKILVPLAEGFEETEAVAIVDVLRRAGLEVVTAALKEKTVMSSRKIPIVADALLSAIRADEFQGIVLPGGMPGSNNLRDSDRVISFVQRIFASGGVVGAICAAPKVLERSGVIDGKKVTCYPGTEREIRHAEYVDEPVVVDGNIITGKAAGNALLFALKIVEKIKGRDTAENIRESIFLNENL